VVVVVLVLVSVVASLVVSVVVVVVLVLVSVVASVVVVESSYIIKMMVSVLCIVVNPKSTDHNCLLLGKSRLRKWSVTCYLMFSEVQSKSEMFDLVEAE
jgi:hypothetical protein